MCASPCATVSGMQAGEQAIIDALGFKGAWSPHGEERVLNKMRRLQRSTAAVLGGFDQEINSLPPVTMRSLFLSDTVALAAIPPDEQNEQAAPTNAVIAVSNRLRSSDSSRTGEPNNVAEARGRPIHPYALATNLLKAAAHAVSQLTPPTQEMVPGS